MLLFTMPEIVKQLTADSQELLSEEVRFPPEDTRVLMRMSGCDQLLPHQEECWGTAVVMHAARPFGDVSQLYNYKSLLVYFGTACPTAPRRQSLMPVSIGSGELLLQSVRVVTLLVGGS